jgi:AraC-like DNA-binding protein
MTSGERVPYRPTGAWWDDDRLTARHACHPALRPQVACYYSVEVPQHERGVVRTLPEGCADLLFDLGPNARAWLSGPRTAARVFEHRGPVSLLGVQLMPGIVHALTGVPANRCVDTSVPLQAVWPDAVQELGQLLHGLQRKRRPGRRAAQLDRFLSVRLHGVQVDARVSAAMERIRALQGALPVTDLAMELGIGTRQLDRLFLLWVGLNPKRLCRIVRFQALLKHMAQGQAPDWADLAAQLGYADQSHLIRDFTRFACVTPTALGA